MDALFLLLAVALAAPPPDPEAAEDAPPTPPSRPPIPGQAIPLPDTEPARPPKPMATADAEAAEAPEAEDARPRMRYELGVRARYVSVPSGLLDAWYTDLDTEGWPVDTARPVPLAATYGLEFLFLRERSTGVIYLEVAQSFMAEGLWDDTDNPNDFRDAEWLRPSPFFGAVILGANGQYAAPIVGLDQTKGKFTLDFIVGGGLGIAVLVGSMDRWTYDYDTNQTAWQQLAAGRPARGQADLKSPVWPVPDFELGFKFGFVDKAWLRILGGLHGGLSIGGSAGGRF